MLEAGVYGLDYRSDASGEVASGEALAVLRDGRILGSDRWGGVFTGDYAYDPAAGANRVNVCLRVPPHGELITGEQAGPEGACIEIVALLAKPSPRAQTEVLVAGKPVAVGLTYIGPLRL